MSAFGGKADIANSPRHVRLTYFDNQQWHLVVVQVTTLPRKTNGRTSVRPLGKIKVSRCAKRGSRALRFLLRTLLLLRCHNATPWFLMNLIQEGLSSRLRRQTTAKQWCIINERRMNRPPRAVSVGGHPKADQRRRARDMLAADPGGG